MKKKILVVDDEEAIRLISKDILKEKDFLVELAVDGRQAIAIFKQKLPDIVLLDLKMPHKDGIETLRELKEIDPYIPVIIITAFGDIPTAVEAVRLGAYDFITKPVDYDKLFLTINRALEKLNLQREIKRLNAKVDFSLESQLGKSKAMKAIIRQINQVAATNFSIILQGETGTGKSLIARIIHDQSKRAKKPFKTVDMGTITETLVESELFGHEKGAFTGALYKKIGHFEAANPGTIFLDELENMSIYMQSKLLSVIEERKISPVGSIKSLDIDIRYIAATNVDIAASINKNKFREDLYYRLGEFIIDIPPLRDRSDEIPTLAYKFLEEATNELGKYVHAISDEAINLLLIHPWPGNVRELKNVIKKAVILSDNEIINKKHIDFLKHANITRDTDDNIVDKLFLGGKAVPLKKFTEKAIVDCETRIITHAMKICKFNKRQAAKILEIDYKTILKKVKQYNI